MAIIPEPAATTRDECPSLTSFLSRDLTYRRQTGPVRYGVPSGNGYLILDIETIPDGRLWIPPAVSTGAVRAASGAMPSQTAQTKKGRPFPPTYAHKVVVVGALWLDEDYRTRSLEVVGAGKTEAGILDALSRFIDDQRPVLVTYNGRSFDLPVIALRSLHHGVQLPWYYQDTNVRHRYSEDGHIDLCDWLADHGATRSGSLDALARLIGLPGKLGIDGSQIAGLYRAGQLEQIQNYCLADVVQTALLFLRFRLLQGVFNRQTYRQVVEKLTNTLSADERLATLMAAIDDVRLLDAA